MDHTLNLTRVGWSASILLTIMHAVALIRMSTLSGETRVFMEKLATIGHPGFTGMTGVSIVILLAEGFIYGWIISAVFVSLYNALLKK